MFFRPTELKIYDMIIEFETIIVLIVRNLLVQTDRVEAVVEDGQNEYFIWL